MKLSDALRKGMEMHPVGCRKAYYVTDAEGVITKTCALFAIYEGMFGKLTSEAELLNDYSVLFCFTPVCRVQCCTRQHEIAGYILHATDVHGRTREEILAWLEREGL